MTRIINLFGGPGSGKSTAASGLFFQMKHDMQSVELVTEYAKDLVYEIGTVTWQFQMLAEQDRRLRRLLGKVDYAITDSPLLLSTIYGEPPFTSDWFKDACRSLVDTYDNINIYVRRMKPYSTLGRIQDETQALILDMMVRSELDKRNDYYIVDGDVLAPSEIRMLLKRYGL